MEPADADEVVFDAPGYFCMYRSGKVDRVSQPVAATGVDDSSGVSSKDAVLDADTGLSVRLFLPKRRQGKKLPVLVYFHGGGFVIGSAKFAMYHNYLTSLASAAGVLAVSVDYRLAPEHQLPAAYDDSWAALQWAASAQDDWIAEHGDAGRVFVAGDSAGGNIVHNVLMKAAASSSSAEDNGGGVLLPAPRIEGAVFLHAFFGGSTAIDGESERSVDIAKKVWAFAFRDAAGGADHPWINPTAPGAPALERLGCERVLVCAAEKDWLAVRDRAYYEALVGSAWPGSAEWLQSSGEEHVFFVMKPDCDNAKLLMDRVAAFVSGA